MTVAENTFEKLGLHTTGAAQYACLLSDNSRIDVTPYTDGTTHLAFVRYGSQNGNSRKRGFMIQPGTVAMNYGYYDTVVGRSGTELLIAVEGFGEYRIQNLSPNITVPIISFDIMKENIKPVIHNLVQDGEFCNIKTGGTCIINLFEDVVKIRTIARTSHYGAEYELLRDDKTTVLGMTYSDARWHMVMERRRLLGEEMIDAYNEVKRQTQLQIPSKHDRDNTGRAIAALSDKNLDGSGLVEPHNLLYRMINTNPIIINNLDQPEFNLYLDKGRREEIKHHDDVADVWGMTIGPMEASMANVAYAALISDGKYVPMEESEAVFKSKIRAKLNELDEAGILETYILAMQKIENSNGGTFTERLVNMCVTEAEYYGAKNTDYLLDTVNFLELAQLKDTVLEFDTSFALGSVLAYGRRGIAQGFLNHFHGKNIIAKEHATKVQYNELINGTAMSSTFDRTTGLFLFSGDSAKEILPVGLEVLAPDDGDDMLTLVDYKKSYSEPTEYKCRNAVINFKWRLNLGKLLMTDVDSDEQSVDFNCMRIQNYIESVAEMVLANTNWYIMHILLYGWDNISVPLGRTEIYESINGKDNRFLVLEDTEEQLVRTGRFDAIGTEYLHARFPANGDRITFGVPNVDEMITDDLEARLGYTVRKFSNVDEPFLLIDEDNFIVENTDTMLRNAAPPIAVLQAAIDSGEMSITKTDSGYSIKEPHWDRFHLDSQDRSTGLLGWGNKVQSDMSASNLTMMMDGLIKKVASLEERMMRVPHTFVGTVMEESAGSFIVLPDGRDLRIKAEKLSGADIKIEDRVFGFERQPGRFSIMKLPIASTYPVPPLGSAEEHTWFVAGGE